MSALPTTGQFPQRPSTPMARSPTRSSTSRSNSPTITFSHPTRRSKEAVRREGAAWAIGWARSVRGARRLGRVSGAGDAREQEPAGTRHPRPLRAAGRSHPLPSLLSRADEGLDRGRASFVALDRSGRGRACGAGRALLHAHRGRGRPRLPDHHDLRRDALSQVAGRPRRAWLPKIQARVYDPRNVPAA